MRANANLAILPRNSVTILSAVLVPINGQFLQKRCVTALDGQGDFIQRPDQTLQRPHKAYAGDGGKSFKEFPVEGIEEPHQLWCQVAAAQASIDIIYCVKSLRITPLAFRRRTQARRDSRRHEDFIAKSIHAHQKRVALNAVVEDFTGYFGDHKNKVSGARCR